MNKKTTADEFFHVDSLFDEPDFNENEGEFLYCELSHMPPSYDNPIYGGEFYQSLKDDLIPGMFMDEQTQGELEIAVAQNFDLYCASLIYDYCFDIDDDTLEHISFVMECLKFGLHNEFWLSYYQSVDLILKLRKSVFQGRTDFELYNCPIDLMKNALDKYKPLPVELTTISKKEIEAKLMLLMIAQ